MPNTTYVGRYNPTLKIWEFGYWLGRIFHVMGRYPNV